LIDFVLQAHGPGPFEIAGELYLDYGGVRSIPISARGVAVAGPEHRE